MTTSTPDDYTYNGREPAKAAPRPAETDSRLFPRLKAWGPNGESHTLTIDASQFARVVEALTTDPGITYRVQAHDITTLTWPMWEACGIECPAMIGATCPGQFDSRQYMDGPADAAHHAKRCPGKSSKFPHAAAEVVHSWTLASAQDETCGDVDQPIGCNHLFRAPEGVFEGPMGAGLILSTDSQGFVTLVRYDTATELDGIWSMLQDEEAKYFRANCEDCTPDTPCADHDE